MKITRRQLQLLIQEEIRQVKPGCYKVYPKKPKSGTKRRKALSKKCKTLPAAKKHLAAIEISKSMREDDNPCWDGYRPGAQSGNKTKIGKSGKRVANCEKINEGDPAKGTGKKPKGSGRRLYTDENPKDTVSVKFRTKSDIQDTLSKKSFKSKEHNRQSQIINLIHQRVRAAYKNAKDPEAKKRLKLAYDYAKDRKEASKRKTQRMRKKK
jgi:hypothetical protein